ncbi:hypothetical protein Y1Q_0014765 [Alligator mississippiensis]|uniref:Uncharacterized protein n=1 Tax=Alligator mississippiensis TaxID=8496 RepID=A0A151M1V7_ALLMI|nr:hypothetical protein Y1Q_0014765 [Alligator mississippiensis]
MLTTAVTTLNPNSSSAGSKTTVGESNETGRGFSAYLNNPVFMTAATEEKKAEGNVEQSVTAQLSSDEMPTLLPSSRTLDVADDFLAIPAPLVDQTAESEPGTLVPNVASPLQWTAAEGPDFTAKPSSLFTDASLNLEAGPDNGHGGFHATASMVTVPPAVPAPTDDWDDTKVGNISQERGTKQEEIKLDHMVTEPPQTAAGDLGEKDMKGLMPFTASAYATTVNLDENDPAGPSPISVWGKKMSTASADQTVVSVLSTLPADEATAANTVENTEPVEEREHVSLPLPEAVADTQSDVFQTLANTLKGVTQETTVSQETDAALPVLTPADLAMHGATSATEEKSKLVTQLPDVSGITQLLSADYPATLVSSAASHLSPEKTPEVEELVTISNEKAVPALAGPDTTRAGMGMQTEETTSRTTVLATPASVVSSVRRTVVPSVRRISTAVTYGLDQLESEGAKGNRKSCPPF